MKSTRSADFLRRALVLGSAAAGLAAWAVAPRARRDAITHAVPGLPRVWYAHRGLHDAGSGLTDAYLAHSGEYVALARRMALRAGYGSADATGPIAPENSLAAFAAACEAGFGIELDIQLTRDGRVVVVHDSTLMRVAGDPRRIGELTYEQLCAIPLFPAPALPGDAVAAPVKEGAAATSSGYTQSGYAQHVPLLSDVLRLVDGRVPLIVEYKMPSLEQWDDGCESLMEKGDALLRDYQGEYVVESFHPGALRWYRMNDPAVCRGQLASRADLHEDGLKAWLAGELSLNWMSRPDFVAYDWSDGNAPAVRLSRFLGAVMVSWTVRSPEEYQRARTMFDRHIIESFVPSDDVPGPVSGGGTIL